MKLGIDFGTCFSFPATVLGKVPVSLLKNEPDLADGIPSVFYYESATGEMVGVKAEGFRMVHPSYGVKQIKKEIRSGNPISRITYNLDGRAFSAKEIIVKIIKYIIEVAQQMAPGIGVTPQELESIVIAVPSLSGSNTYRQIILEAVCEASGLSRDSVRIIDEPVAAALSYFSTRKNISNGTTVLTYDLGGGTFDTAIVRYDASKTQKFGSSGFKVYGFPYPNRLSEIEYQS
jgi:molecular chaperone DnaK (HSP70)